MDWIWNQLLVPLLDVLYVPCDWMLGWSSRFGAVAGVTIVGVVSGIAVIAVQKYGSKQSFLARCKADLALLKLRQRSAKASGDDEALVRAQTLQGRIGGKYMGAALKPSLWTVPLIGLIGLWCGSRLGFTPVRPGAEITVIAHFEDHAKGFAHVITEGPLAAAGPAIAAIGIPAPAPGEEAATGKQARWILKAGEDGKGLLTVRHEGRSYPLTIPVASRGGRPPEPVTVFAGATQAQDSLQALEVKLSPSMPAAWWNLTLQWGGLYLLVAVGVALILRFSLGVQ